MFFNNMYRLCIEVFLEVCFSSVYNVYTMQWGSTVDIYSNIVAFIFIVLFSILVFSIPMLYLLYPSKNFFYSFKMSRFSILLDEYKLKRFLMLDHFIFFARRFVLISVIIFRWEFGLLQTLIFLTSWIGVLVWKIIARPFNKMLMNIQDLMFEFFLTLIIAFYLNFINSRTELATSGAPHIQGIICVILIICLVFLGVSLTIMIFISNCREKRRNAKIKQKLRTENNKLEVNDKKYENHVAPPSDITKGISTITNF